MNNKAIHMYACPYIYTYIIHKTVGLLGAPNDLSASYNDESKDLYLKWTPPFILNGIDVKYEVRITPDNITIDDDDQGIPEVTTNLTELTVNMADNSFMYACVAGCTKAGRGNESCGEFLFIFYYLNPV